jgi:hypothetical protein
MATDLNPVAREALPGFATLHPDRQSQALQTKNVPGNLPEQSFISDGQVT